MPEIKDPSQIIHPQSDDVVSAEEIIAGLHAVLKKHSYALLFNSGRGVFVLAKVNAFGSEARCIAEIERITPDGAVWKPLDWTPKELKTQ